MAEKPKAKLITPEQAGTIKLGMTEKEARTILGEPVSEGIPEEIGGKILAFGEQAELKLTFDRSGFLIEKDASVFPQDLAKVTKENVAKIKRGMKIQEVFSILGRGVQEADLGDKKMKVVTWKDGDKILLYIQFDSFDAVMVPVPVGIK